MNRLAFVMIVHDHQPVGNFDGVFRQAYDDAYAPFLAFLERHPALRLALHTSGPLLDWIAEREPDYLTRLRALVTRGQVEPWGGGLYEPILPAIAEVDRQGQIAAMSERLERTLGAKPRGLWLTERVWEPGLASSLAAAGVAYTAVDDAHFVAAGLEREERWGRFLTEDQGMPVSVFPIHRELRYLIPFGEPRDTIALLRRVAEGAPDRLAVLGDDGEKFGVWPGTHRLCYDEGWLERFAAALAAEDWIDILTPAEAVARLPARGPVYLPTASYHEMQEWALPPAAQQRYHRIAERLKAEMGDAALDLLRGGHWRAFQARYPESNRMHKRMLRASRRLWAAPHPADPAWREARDHLWRSQCNCPYWHGVFGGLYLPHLRAAVYRELIAAERAVAPAKAAIEEGDLDLDGDRDAVLETPAWAAWTSARGGRLWAFDDRIGHWNYGDTLARRPEAYHDALRRAGAGGGDGQSIHDAVRWKEPGHEHLLEGVDAHGRDSLLDVWEEEGRRHDWAEQRFDLVSAGGAVVMRLPESDAPALEKRFSPDAAGALEIAYTLTSSRPRSGTLEVATNLGLHVRQADDRWVEVNGRREPPSHWGAVAEHAGATSAAFVDGWAGLRLEIDTDRPATLRRAPIETVSLSEAGAEAVFQGVEARFRFEVGLAPGEPWRVRFRWRPSGTAAS
jgi:4-alpha-glucanotransferase